MTQDTRLLNPATTHTTPLTPPWMVALRGKSARFIGFMLAVIDAMISYRGMRNWGYPETEAAAIAIFIWCLQTTISYLLCSGYDIGSEYEARFFRDSGLMGVVKRAIGVLILLFFLGFCSFDILSNYAAFSGGQWLPSGGYLQACFNLLAAIALSVGDELLHLVADIVDASSTRNEHENFRDSDLLLQIAYQRKFIELGKEKAEDQAAKDAQNWQYNRRPPRTVDTTAKTVREPDTREPNRQRKGERK